MRYTKILPAIALTGLMSLFSLPLHADQPLTYNRVDFEVMVQEEVDNDEVTVTMSVEKNGAKPSELAGEINTLMQAAIAEANDVVDVRVKTGNYSIRPVYTREKRLDHWSGSQTLVLNSRNSAAIAELMQTLQQSMQVKSTRYSVSQEQRSTVQGGMITEALARFHKRAALIADGLGFQKYRLVNVNVRTSGSHPAPVYAMAMDSASSRAAAPPALEGGWSDIKVIVSGTIEMEVTI
jgi:predicted secreted protein